jgi:hypothetical protein
MPAISSICGGLRVPYPDPICGQQPDEITQRFTNLLPIRLI